MGLARNQILLWRLQDNRIRRNDGDGDDGRNESKLKEAPAVTGIENGKVEEVGTQEKEKMSRKQVENWRK